jgi:hypothetical protein
METKNTRPIALVTGASGGIGLEFARLLAREGYDLALVARSKDKLNELAHTLHSQHQAQVLVIPCDLSAPDAPAEVHRQVQAMDIPIDLLVNNAGFASYGKFAELDVQRELQMIQLNISALTHLTGLFLPEMIARGHGKIINVASTAAFQPGPLMAVYYASKAFVLSFSEAIANELQGTGVIVSALCPGPTESGFQARADMQDSKLVQNGLMDAATVAEAGYRGLQRGETVVIPGLKNQLGALAPRLLPRKLVTRVVRNVQERTGTP